jgi:beta-lactamase regulating signal transducer with metallopeptidase domain
MTAALDWNALAQISAARIVDCLVAGTLITLFAGVAMKLARRINSGTRFAVWFSALMAIATLPLLSAWWSRAGSISSVQTVASRPAIVLPESWALYLFAAWVVIAGWGLLRVGAGLMHLRALRKSCEPVNLDSFDSALRETLTRSQTNRQVALYVSDQVSVPTTIGFGKPAILIPRWLMTEMSAVELNQILLHELAHLRRRDDWTNLAQKIVKAIFFFHPAVWWIEKRVSLEREMACDDAVLAETSSPRAYAQCLARLAEKSLVRRSMALAQAAVGRIRQTSLRVAQILDGTRPGGTTHVWKPVVFLVAGFAVVCAVGVSRAPRLIAFQDDVPAHPIKPAVLIASHTFSNPAALELASRNRETAGAVAWNAKAVIPRPAVAKPRRKPASVSSESSSLENCESAVAVERPNLPPDPEDVVHLAGVHISPGASTETVFLVVEGEYGPTGQPLYQISVWRITMLQPTHSVIGKTVPRKT